jgi:hypothetical protein
LQVLALTFERGEKGLVFRTEALSLAEWLIITAMSLTVSLVVENEKWIRRK